MKKWIALFLALLTVLSLAACGKKQKEENKDNEALSWQEQYALGVRYLSEGNYEEAILAFEAAIALAPKQADAYIGAAEAYIALGQPEKAQSILEAGFANADDTSEIKEVAAQYDLEIEDMASQYDPEIEERTPTFDPSDFDIIGTCGEDAQWGYVEETGELTIIGTGEMENYEYDYETGRKTAPWSGLPIKAVKIYGVTTIGDHAFFGYPNLTEVTIPDSVTSIGNGAFAFCDGLTEVTIPNSVITIGDNAFNDCDNLAKITIPNSVITIGDHAFLSCDSLTEITIPDSVTSIGNAAFSCSSLTEIVIPGSVTTFGGEAFATCANLTKININDGVTTIGSGMFGWCSSLTEATIPDSVASIGNGAFNSCESLTDVYFTGTKAQWNAIEIGEDNGDLTSATIHFNS